MTPVSTRAEKSVRMCVHRAIMMCVEGGGVHNIGVFHFVLSFCFP
jgi:hypothetical protein